MNIFKMNLTSQMFLALVLGCFTGITFSLLQWDVSYFKPFGDIFIRLIRMIVVPLVFVTLVSGAASVSDVSRLGSIAVKTVVYYFATTAIAVSLGLIAANLLQPGAGLDLSLDVENTINVAAPSLLKVLMDIVPLNPMDALSSGNMLQIIFFAVLLGIAVSVADSSDRVVSRFFEAMSDIMLKLTSYVMLYAPIGVFALLTFTVGTYGLDVLLPLIKLIMVLFVTCIIHFCIVYLPCLKYAVIKPGTFFKEIVPTLLIAFSTASSAAALSSNLMTVEKLGASKDVASFSIPLGNTINMDGTALYMGVCAVFAATIYNIPLTFDKQLIIVLMAILASVGTMGVPGAGVIMISIVFTQVGIPLEAVALIAGVDRVLDMMRTSLNVLGDATGALFVSKWEENKSPAKS